MIEHVGVVESSTPYAVTALQDRDLSRERVLGEAVRLMRPGGRAFFDFPNALFPVDFWHGDSVGSFRVHGPSDALLPTGGRFQRWVARAGGVTRLCPLRDRLKMRQVSKRWWGRLLRLPMGIHLAVLDFLVAGGLEFFGRIFAPYLVFEVRHRRLPEERRAP
jgi:SAM-dependent methyltransferase